MIGPDIGIGVEGVSWPAIMVEESFFVLMAGGGAAGSRATAGHLHAGWSGPVGAAGKRTSTHRPRGSQGP